MNIEIVIFDLKYENNILGTYNDALFSVIKPNDFEAMFSRLVQTWTGSCKNIISVSTYKMCWYSGKIKGKNKR